MSLFYFFTRQSNINKFTFIIIFFPLPFPRDFFLTLFPFRPSFYIVQNGLKIVCPAHLFIGNFRGNYFNLFNYNGVFEQRFFIHINVNRSNCHGFRGLEFSRIPEIEFSYFGLRRQ